MNGTATSRVLAAVAAATTMLMWVAGCDTPARRPTPAPSASATSPSPGPTASTAPTAAVGVWYRPVGNLCTAADASALRRQAGDAQPQPTAEFHRTGAGAVLSCTIRLGSRGNAGAVILIAGVFDEQSARPTFERLRQMRPHPVTAVAGLGDGAYSYLDAVNRPHVVVYHANLHLTVGYVPTTVLNNPAELVPALTEVAAATLAGLRRLATPPTPTAGAGGVRRPACD